MEKRTVQTAVAVRWVGRLEVMEIMCAVPEEVRWESVGVLGFVDAVVSSRPRAFAVLMHCVCSGVREGELIRRWVPCDAWMRYEAGSKVILRTLEEYRRCVGCRGGRGASR